MIESEKRVHEAIDELRAGRMVVLMDDHDRENEGDLCMAAEKVTPEAIAFMATYGRGLICLALTCERTRELGLPLMVRDNKSRFGTNFTVSIDAKDGITTGISAADRARTILVAVSNHAGPEDLVSPGHVFPLQSVPGGVLERAGQTEGAVDLARIAGLKEAGVICEIMKDDGTMARRPDLEEFCKRHGLKMLEIGDIIRYRLARESLIKRVMEKEVDVKVGNDKVRFKLILFKSRIHDCPREYMALVYGEIDENPVLCRVHQGHLSFDIFDIKGARKQVSKDEALRMIVQDGKGVFVFIPPRNSILEEISMDAGKKDYRGRMENNPGEEEEGEIKKSSGLPESQAVLREFGMGAQVLVSLGVRQIRLITKSPKKLYGLEGFGLKVVENVAP